MRPAGQKVHTDLHLGGKKVHSSDKKPVKSLAGQSVHSTASLTVLDPKNRIVYSKRKQVQNSPISTVRLKTKDDLIANRRKSTDKIHQFSNPSTRYSTPSTKITRYSAGDTGLVKKTGYTDTQGQPSVFTENSR